MAHRLGDGTKIQDLDTARQEWRAARRSPSTYCNKSEYNAWVEDIGELIYTTPDGTELRRHATVKALTRGGAPRIAHNVVIIGNPAKYAAWASNPNKSGWMAEWTFWPDGDLERKLEELQRQG